MSDNGSIPGGPLADEPAGIRDDDFGLDGDLKTALAKALESRWNADDPGATTLDDDVADTAATPVPATDTSPTTEPPQGQSGEDGGGGERAAQGEAAIPAEAVPAAEPTPDEFNAGDYFNDYFGTPLNREQSAELARMIGGLQALSPDQRAELDRVLAGGQVGQYPATQGVPVQPQVQPQVADPSAPDPAVALLGARPDDEYLAAQWDMSAAVARQQHTEAEALRADIYRNTQMEMQRQQAAIAERIDAAESEWRAQYPVINDAEFQALKDSAVRSGTFPALMAAHHNDAAAATRAIYEQQFWSNPELRERAIANVASGRVAGDPATPDPQSPVAQQQATVDAGRQALAASVAGGGGAAPQSTTSTPTDPSQRKQAMISELAQHDFT